MFSRVMIVVVRKTTTRIEGVVSAKKSSPTAIAADLYSESELRPLSSVPGLAMTSGSEFFSAPYTFIIRIEEGFLS